MAPYPETETMTMKRIEVALKKRDWELLREGINKIHEKTDLGHTWEYLDEWQDMLNQAENEGLPKDLWDDFSRVIKKLILKVNVSIEKVEAASGEIIAKPNFQEIKKSKEKMVVFYDENIEDFDFEEIKKYKTNLNIILNKKANTSPSPNWMEKIATITTALNKPTNQLYEFLFAVKDLETSSSIIHAGHSSSVIKNFIDLNLDFAISGTKDSADNLKRWALYPIAGLTNLFVCSNCGKKILKTDFSFDAIVGKCTECEGVSYPDITDVSGANTEVSPDLWYKSYNELTTSKVWILINPPAKGKKSAVADMLITAAANSDVKRVYVISKSAEIGTYWKTTLSNVTLDCSIKDYYSNIAMFLTEFKNNEIAYSELCCA